MQKAAHFEHNCWRAVDGGRRAPGEHWVQWVWRITRRVRARCEQSNIPSLVVLYILAVHGWAGHLARLPGDRPC
eukprot:15436565-Alexandrium_andersonii.AAC.1